jgi:monoamine oxidase
MDRRDFLRLLSLQAAAWSLGCGRHEGGARGPRALPTNPFSGHWMGDDFRSGHRIRDGLPPLVGGTLEPDADVVVIGGGISGLAAARALARDGRGVIVLEQAQEPGGNSKSARWGEVEYSIGAAYFLRPDAGSELETLYRDVGVLERAVRVPKGEALFGGRMREGFWDGATDPSAAEATRRIRDAWREIYERRYPDIPWTRATTGWTRARFERADRLPFARTLDELKAPPHVRMFCEYYCWSSFGGSAEEVSTYAALNFLTAEFGEVLALPGGNAGVAKALLADLATRGVRISTGMLAASVQAKGAGVEVVALQGDAVHRFPARACVLAIPRFIAGRIVADFPEERAAIVDGMKWRAYLVANVLLARRPDASWYDAYRLEELDPRVAAWTDLILADFVASPRSERCVLTAYRALPFDGGRAELLTPEDYPRHREAVRRDLVPWLGALGLAERDIVDINLARWGHPLVLAQPGQLANGRLERLSAPLGRVAFAHQDRYGVPAIENAIGAGLEAAREAGAMLRS